MKGIERIMERTFEAGRVAGQAAGGSAADCPYGERLAPNLRKVWLPVAIAPKLEPSRAGLSTRPASETTARF
jgi:ribosome modulation factor